MRLLIAMAIIALPVLDGGGGRDISDESKRLSSCMPASLKASALRGGGERRVQDPEVCGGTLGAACRIRSSRHHKRCPERIMHQLASSPGNRTGEFLSLLSRLASQNEKFMFVDDYGSEVQGLNRTIMIYHKPFSHLRSKIMSKARSIAHDLNTKQLSRLLNSLMSLSRVGFDNMRIILEITRLLSKSLYELTAKRAARTFHSIAKLGVPDKISINVCASLVLREKGFRSVDVEGLSQLVEGAGYLSTRRSCQKVVIVMVEEILKTLNSNSTKRGLLTPKDWFRLLMGLGRLRFRGEDSTLQSLIDHFGHQDQLLEAYKPWEIAHICWSLTSLGCQERWIVRALAERFCEDVDTANLQGAVFVLWSMGVLGVQDDAVLEKLSRIICSKASRLTAHNLVHCVAAFHKLSTVRKEGDAQLVNEGRWNDILGILLRRTAEFRMRQALMRLGEKWKVVPFCRLLAFPLSHTTSQCNLQILEDAEIGKRR